MPLLTPTTESSPMVVMAVGGEQVSMAILEDIVIQQLKAKMVSMESILDADLLTIHSDIVGGLETQVRNKIESLPDQREHIGIILHTGGGLVEVAERIADTIRYNYKEVTIPCSRSGYVCRHSLGNVRRPDHDGLLFAPWPDRPADPHTRGEANTRALVSGSV